MSPRDTSRQPAREEEAEDRAPARDALGRARKPYRAPRLTVYGRLAELTRFGGSLFVDSGGGLGNQP